METLNKRRIEGIIAFYNLFCEKMGLEECKGLLETRYLLHSIVEFINTGSLTYYTHENFGFHRTVKFLRDHLDANLTDRLDAELAEKEHPLEIAKILVALLYAFRLELTEEIVSYVNELPPKLNSEIAAIIQYLDDEELQGSSADVLAHILVARASKTMATMDSLALLNVSPPTRRSKLIDICNNSLRFNAKQKSSINTPQTAVVKPREVVFGIDSSSPITAVINSPRGANVTSTKQQKRRIGELKEQMEALRRQCDQLEDECAGLRDKLLDAEKDTETLHKRNKRVETELRRQFEEALAAEKVESAKLRAALKKSDAEIERMNACHIELRFDKDGAHNDAKNAEEVNKMLSECLDETRRKLRDEAEMLSFTREKQMEAENRARDLEVRFHEVCEIHRQEISAQQLRTEHLLAQKDDDFRKQLETSLLVQANYKTQVDQLSDRLRDSDAKVEKVRRELERFQQKYSLIEKQSAVWAELQTENQSEIDKLRKIVRDKEMLISELYEQNITTEPHEDSPSKSSEAKSSEDKDEDEARRLRELDLRNERVPPHLREHYFFETNNMSSQKGYSPSIKRAKKKNSSHSISACLLTPLRAMRRKHNIVEESPPN